MFIANCYIYIILCYILPEPSWPGGFETGGEPGHLFNPGLRERGREARTARLRSMGGTGEAAEAWHLLAEGQDLGAGLALTEAADAPLQARSRQGGWA